MNFSLFNAIADNFTGFGFTMNFTVLWKIFFQIRKHLIFKISESNLLKGFYLFFSNLQHNQYIILNKYRKKNNEYIQNFKILFILLRNNSINIGA
ncbi:hypothetical protein THIOM_001508 [Candidatus Thiomargarita nelsonii]|uniref:Uncharacterized protein n=1 Tax=Candidatus Thiomargarita nelsonii TaxID=1003181 RepID=A0A176S416_9GAMM|nr:hypothetical protein THIOM_001508 [Candidatus Thiomargarita nelsonii]